MESISRPEKFVEKKFVQKIRKKVYTNVSNFSPEAITKYRSFHADLNILSFILLIINAPLKTTELLIAAILSAFLPSFDNSLCALSPFEPPLKPSLCNNLSNLSHSK